MFSSRMRQSHDVRCSSLMLPGVVTQIVTPSRCRRSGLRRPDPDRAAAPREHPRPQRRRRGRRTPRQREPSLRRDWPSGKRLGRQMLRVSETQLTRLLYPNLACAAYILARRHFLRTTPTTRATNVAPATDKAIGENSPCSLFMAARKSAVVLHGPPFRPSLF